MKPTYIKNTWYMFAWSDEVQDKPFSRTIMETPVVVYRHGDELIALQDRCPHRFAPLSMGQVTEEGNIECPYHGLQFSGTGSCVHNIFSSAAPAAAKIPTYKIHEVDNTIWIWVGDQEKADIDRIPVIEHHRKTDKWKYVKGVSNPKCDYRLMCDNLMDLSHTHMLHPGLGGRAYLPKVRSWSDGDDVLASFATEVMANPFGRDVIDDENVKHLDTIRWIAPSNHVIVSDTGYPGWERPDVSILSAHILTPESPATSHYFWSSTVPEGMPEDILVAELHKAFDGEDKPMVEAVQNRMQGKEIWDLNPILLPTDTGAVRMRRKLEELIDAEYSAAET